MTGMRELRVEDALLYLDQVKVEFGDRPHIYNEFLDIMKTFKTQQIDTPGVIRRVSNLFQGNRKLVLGFNTFLPEGYKIELPLDGDGPAVAVYRAPGSNVDEVLRESAESRAVTLGASSSNANTAATPPLGMVVAPARPPPGPAQLPTAASLLQPPKGAMPPYRPGTDQQQSMMAHGAPGSVPQHMGPNAPSDFSNGPGGYAQGPMTMPGGPRGRPGMGPPQPPPVGRAPPMLGEGPHAQRSGQQQVMIQGPPGVRPPPGEGGLPPRNLGPSLHMETAPSPGMPTTGPGYGPSVGLPAPLGPPAPPAPQGGAVAAPQPPMEFDHAINYVTTIKKRFANEPETYKKFLEILHTYQKEQRGIKEVLDEVSDLFADHPDLLKEFTYFLPDAVQAQAKAQLEQVAKEAEARKRIQATKAIMTTAQGMQRDAQALAHKGPREFDGTGSTVVAIPFGATQGRTEEKEMAIIRSAAFGCISFDPVRPPRRGDLTPVQAAVKKGRPTDIPELPIRPNTSEASFFDRAREHLKRKELAPEKPASTRRHTPYSEFLKCLHLFAAAVLNKEELVAMLKTLFIHGHVPKSGISSNGANYSFAVAHDANELLRDFEEILVGRGPYADQEHAFKGKSKYGTMATRDFDFSGCDTPTPSYVKYPSDYPKKFFLSYPGQTDVDTQVLNDSLLCISAKRRGTRSIEDYNGVRKRHNAYEEAMFRVEDERYEMDMAIERNVHALRQIEPFAQEVQALREQEEKDGQPIGRLQYRLNRYALNTIHINAIARIYGDRGDEILQYLLRNPLIVLPIVHQRIKQKDVEWRKAKLEMGEMWNRICEANYEGSLDVRCYFHRRDLERLSVPSKLLDECRNAQDYCTNPKKSRNKSAPLRFQPEFALRSPDPESLLYQPYVAVKCAVGFPHRDAFQVISHHVRNMASLTVVDRERIGRVWAEFMTPWFGYPTWWVADEVRTSFGGKLTPTLVKFALGQKIMTVYGEGVIVSFMAATDRTGPRYRIKLAYGVGYLSPAALLYAIPARDTAFVRRDGVMVRESSPVHSGASAQSAILGEKIQLLFGTESIYVFLRLYSLLCAVLADTRHHAGLTVATDPADSYYPAKKKDATKISPRIDFTGVLSTLKKVLAKQVETRELETFGRKLSVDLVHQIACLPKLVERCAAALIKVAREDVLLQLYDYCHYRQRVDPAAVRSRCLIIAPDAFYRIQYNSSSELLFCNYLPKGATLLTSRPDDEEADADEMMVDAVRITEEMEAHDEDDEMVEEDEDQYGRPLKRAKA